MLFLCRVASTNSATPLKYTAWTWQEKSPAGLKDGYIVSLMKETAAVVWNSCKWQNSSTKNLQPGPAAKFVKLREMFIWNEQINIVGKVLGDIFQFDSQSLELLSWQVEYSALNCKYYSGIFVCEQTNNKKTNGVCRRSQRRPSNYVYNLCPSVYGISSPDRPL